MSAPSLAVASSSLLSALLVLAGAALFGTVGTAQALGPDAPPLQLAAARLLLAALLLLGAAVLAGQVAGLGLAVRRAPTWWAGIGQACFNVCFLAAMTRAGVAVGTLVAIGAAPLITGLLARQVSARWLGATTVALVGLLLLVGGQLGSESPPTVAGIMLALGAAASYATYILAGNAAARRSTPTQAYLAVAFSVSAVLTTPLLVRGDPGWLAHGGGVLLVVYLAAVPTLLAYSLFNRGLRGVRASTASTLGLVEPVVAAGLAVVVLDERLGAVATAGAGLVLAGLLMVVRSSQVER